MAKKEIKEKAIEETLWDAANKLRGTVEPAEYKHVVLGLIFLKFASDKFEEHRARTHCRRQRKIHGNGRILQYEQCVLSGRKSRWSYIIKKCKTR